MILRNKIAGNLVVSAVCLNTLLYAMVAHATDVATQPILSGGLAEPNLVFIVDNSGSMDAEILVNTESGALWWDRDAGTAWDVSGPRDRQSNSRQFRKLFPQMAVGDGAGIESVGNQLSFPVPPVRELAWVRSSEFNPLYYNPAITYRPWLKEIAADGSELRFADASLTATPPHPFFSAPTVTPSAVINLFTVQESSTNQGHTGDLRTFQFLKGMRFPQFALNDANNSSQTHGAIYNGAGSQMMVRLPYFPATFWVRETCDLTPNTSLPGRSAIDGLPEDCVAAPTGGGTLKRYQIRNSGGGITYPGGVNQWGRTLTQEKQNFANWYLYYRKRKLMLAAAMGSSLNRMSDGLRIGTTFYSPLPPNSQNITMKSTTTTPANDGRVVRKDIAAQFASLRVSSSTPTKELLDYVGKKYDTQADLIQYACQRNSAFVLTDGFPTLNSSMTTPAYDRTRFGGTLPYSPVLANSIADFALYHYTKRMRATGANPLPAGRVPKGDPSLPNPDLNPDLHMNTFVATLGAQGLVWPSQMATNGLPASTIPWDSFTIASENRESLDDIWHATINGRGRMLLANNADQVSAAISSVLYDMGAKSGAQSNVLLVSANLTTNDYAYLGRFQSGTWNGDFTKHAIDSATGQITTDTYLWSAAAKLDLIPNANLSSQRVLATKAGPFDLANVGPAIASSLPPGAVAADVVNYLRGDRSKEGFNPTDLRTRRSRLGAIIGSTAAFNANKSVAFVVSNDGFLHAFDVTESGAGRELWGYAPAAALPGMARSADKNWGFRFIHDGPPNVAKVGSSEMLFGSMGAAGTGWYALDVSNAASIGNESTLASKVRWELPAAGDTEGLAPLMGTSVGKPLVVKTRSHGDVVLLTSGYNASNSGGSGRLFVRKASDGTAVMTLSTPTSGSADPGLAHINAFRELDGTVRYVYGGDERGNLWRFDLGEGATQPSVMLLATLRNQAGVAQPVTSRPALVSYKGKKIVLVGTGRVLGSSDFSANKPRQTLYAIRDNGSPVVNLRSDLVAQTMTTHTDGTRTISNEPVNWEQDRGWFVDLPAEEQINLEPLIGVVSVSFLTNVAGSDVCGLKAYRYGLTIAEGGPLGEDPVGSPYGDGTTAAVSNILVTTNGQQSNSPPPVPGPGVPPACPPGSIVSLATGADGSIKKVCQEKPPASVPRKAGWRQVVH